MNRGYDGNDIFVGNKSKAQFLDYLEGAFDQMKIRLFAYCVIDNHYHLVLENSSGINEISVFSNLSFSSLRSLYRRTKMANRDIGPCA
jgi:hypothetical protein